MENREKILVIDPKSGLERFIGNKKLYHDYLEKFLYDGSFEEFCAATAMENTVMADEALHTLIGTSANLSLDLLHHVASEAVLQLKGNDSPENIQKIVDMVTEAYTEACMAVREYLDKEQEG
jgi:HPt (histidine-containing phosphotransfer) domain-containing protein